MKFKTILADPPWDQPTLGHYKRRRHNRPDDLPYRTMSLDAIKELPVHELADEDSLLFLWTTNAFLRPAFDVMDSWGFQYHAPITWVKPSGLGNYFISRTQFILFGYKGKLKMNARYKPNVIFASPKRHSQKPEESYELIEEVSFGPRLELFARTTRPGWTVLGNEIDGMEIADAMTGLATTRRA